MDKLASRTWRVYRAALIAHLPPICGICGQPVDKTLKGTHRDGPTIDHRIPRSRGGAKYDISNCQLAHQRCNAAKRDRRTVTTHSRTW